MELKIDFPASSTKAKLREVLKAVCAILNSCKEDGMLIVFSEDRPYSDKDADDITRKIEQVLEATFGLSAARDILDKISPKDNEDVHEMHYKITPTKSLPSPLYTIAYNLFCTSNTQIHQIPSSEPLGNIMDVIKGEQKREQKDVLGNHQKEFFHGKRIALEETKEVQLKLMKDESSKKSDLATRLTNASNKLAQYVSGFANGSGGHVYCGIHLNEKGFYVVQGQTVLDQNEIICKVENTIDKLLVWSDKAGKNSECLKKGEQWDIYFEEVSNAEEPIDEMSMTEEPKYVIVISVNSHDKGVFVKEPESYLVVKGKVKLMSFGEWGQRFRLADYRNVFPHEKLPSLPMPAEEDLPANEDLPADEGLPANEAKLLRSPDEAKLLRSPGRCKWSSPEARKKHIVVLKKLILLRNNGDEEEFTNYKKQLSEETSDETYLNIKCLVQQQDAANFFRKRLLAEAESKLNENETFLNEVHAKCDDVRIYQIRRLYWTSVVKRAQQEYGECRELCEDALQASQHQPNVLVVPWIHYNRAKILEIDIAKQGDFAKERSLTETCLGYYESALRSSLALGDFPGNLVADLLQRALIGMARVSLGAYSDGEHVVHKACSRDDIKRADYLLEVVDSSVVQRGWLMTRVSKAEYQLVRSERHYRSWEEFSKPRFIKKALKQSNKALRTADDKKFKDISVFAQGQIDILKKLVDKKEKL